MKIHENQVPLILNNFNTLKQKFSALSFDAVFAVHQIISNISKMVNLLTLLMISTSFHDNSISRYDKNIRITKFIKNTTFLAGLQNFTKIIYYNKS